MPWGACHDLLDGGPSRNGPLLGLSESLRGDTQGTHPRQLETMEIMRRMNGTSRGR
jgi:hypothetical protein